MNQALLGGIRLEEAKKGSVVTVSVLALIVIYLFVVFVIVGMVLAANQRSAVEAKLLDPETPYVPEVHKMSGFVIVLELLVCGAFVELLFNTHLWFPAAVVLAGVPLIVVIRSLFGYVSHFDQEVFLTNRKASYLFGFVLGLVVCSSTLFFA
ncbi:MAG: hypothetical protein ACQR33_05790 [Candidatus Saccharibacteria bacterium]